MTQRSDLKDIVAISVLITVIIIAAFPYMAGACSKPPGKTLKNIPPVDKDKSLAQKQPDFNNASAPIAAAAALPTQSYIVEEVQPQLIPDSLFEQFNTNLSDVIGSKQMVITNVEKG